MRYFLTLLLVLVPLYSENSDFSLVLKKPYNDALFDITQDYDRQISAIGFSNNFKTSSNNANNVYTNPFDYLRSVSEKHGSEINLITINNKAQITQDKIIKIPKFNKAVALLKTPSNGYFVGGYSNDGALIVLKLDSSGNIIFNKKFGSKNQDKMSTLVALQDGGVLAVGSSITSRYTNDNLFENGLGGNDIFISRFSKDGTKLWSKKYGTEYDDKGIDAVEASDGTIMVLSTTKNLNKKDITIMRISENGNKIWLSNHNYDNPTTAYKIIKLKDDNFLVSLTEQNSVYKDQIKLLKIDLHNHTIMEKKIRTTYSSGLKDIKEYANGDIIGVGFVKDSYNSDGLVMNLSGELKLLCQEHFGGDNYDIFNAVSILHNSQSALSGLTTPEKSQESDMWILKVNKDCTIAQVPLQTVDLYKALKKLFAKEIAANKLSIKQDLSIEFSDYRLYYKSGEYKLTKTQKLFLDHFGKKLMNFLYLHKEQIATLEVNGHTSSEWGDANFSDTYLNNAKLSLNRSFAALSYMFQTQDTKIQKFLTKILKGSGESYRKRVLLNDLENKEKSRRISLKIILKSALKNPQNLL